MSITDPLFGDEDVAEASRQEAEKLREIAETARQHAEDERVCFETVRRSAEVVRLMEEASRQINEGLRYCAQDMQRHRDDQGLHQLVDHVREGQSQLRQIVEEARGYASAAAASAHRTAETTDGDISASKHRRKAPQTRRGQRNL